MLICYNLQSLYTYPTQCCCNYYVITSSNAVLIVVNSWPYIHLDYAYNNPIITPNGYSIIACTLDTCPHLCSLFLTQIQTQLMAGHVPNSYAGTLHVTSTYIITTPD